MRILVCFALACGLAAAGVVHRAPLAEGWSVSDTPVPDDHKFQIRFSLKQRNLHEVYHIALEVSNPKSSQYGKYMGQKQLNKMTEPSPEHFETVYQWLRKANIKHHRDTSNIIVAELTHKEAAALLSTKLLLHVNAGTGQEVVRAGDYEIPTDVDAALSAVYGMHGFPLPPRESMLPNATAMPAKVTPAVIIQTYKVSGVAASGQKNSQAVAEFQGQTMKPTDLTTFFKDFVPNAPSADAKISKFVGNPGTGTGGIEASLDVDYIMGPAPGIATEFWYWKGNDFCGDLESWTAQLLSSDAPPLVTSVSYGWQGVLSRVGCTTTKVNDVDANFAKLAANGITIIFASGDSGSGLTSNTLYPSWPASSQWVTAVGSTRFESQTVGQPEMATDQFGSGGGFSTLVDAFDAQKTAVKNYLATAPGLPPSTMFPASGRATPDVAALGEGFQVEANGRTLSVGGTSASTPTFAGLVSLLNEARLKAGKPAMGYLNTWLYQHPEAFTDITQGSNKIGRGGQKLTYGFECTKGWDPVTGLGTPLFDKMLAAAMGTESEIVV